jgi:hypothetical protein
MALWVIAFAVFTKWRGYSEIHIPGMQCVLALLLTGTRVPSGCRSTIWTQGALLLLENRSRSTLLSRCQPNGVRG